MEKLFVICVKYFFQKYQRCQQTHFGARCYKIMYTIQPLMVQMRISYIDYLSYELPAN